MGDRMHIIGIITGDEDMVRVINGIMANDSIVVYGNILILICMLNELTVKWRINARSVAIDIRNGNLV